jgi:hypothetical protein
MVSAPSITRNPPTISTAITAIPLRICGATAAMALMTPSACVEFAARA